MQTNEAVCKGLDGREYVCGLANINSKEDWRKIEEVILGRQGCYNLQMPKDALWNKDACDYLTDLKTGTIKRKSNRFTLMKKSKNMQDQNYKKCFQPKTI